MNPPGDADTDGSPSNCTAFFISTVHDLSLNETHAPRSPPPHTSHFLFPSPSVSCSTFISPCPTVTFFLLFNPPPFFFCTAGPPSLFLSIFAAILVFVSVCVSLCCCSEHTPQSPFPSLVLSLVQMCPWSVVAWLGDNRSDFETGGWQPCCH